MELKKGMYVRTKYNDFCNMVAIRKIDEIDDDGSFWIDDYIIDTCGYSQDKLHEEDVELASKVIANVIKSGDYVNGVLVTETMIKMRDEQGVFGLPDKYEMFVEEIPVKKIVTKEQFALIEYEVR